MPVQSPSELFETKIPERIQNKPDLVEKINATYKFVVEGEAGGTWFVDLTKPGGEVVAEDKDADCTIKVKDANLVAIANGKLNGRWRTH
jgi:SCP-2 sterol transfer family.